MSDPRDLDLTREGLRYPGCPIACGCCLLFWLTLIALLVL